MGAFKNREVLNIVVVGHVDHGKSTLIGRLLYDTDSLPQGTIDKVKRIAKETGKPFEYAYLLDAFEEEQKQGITIDTTQIQFQTEKRDYVIIDAPGHKEFLKNMISGAADAEAAFLIIDAKEGVQEQSRRHAYILSLLGIRKVYVVINKMDLVGYEERIYQQVKEEMAVFLSELGVHPIAYIPGSSYYGENILIPSDHLSWYNGNSVLQAMDDVEKEAGLDERALRFPIQDVYKFDDRRIIAGRIESGTLRQGDEITIYPEGKKTTVRTIESWQPSDQKDAVSAGESVGITVADEFFNKRGEVIAKADQPPLTGKTFLASVFWMGKRDLETNKRYKIKISTQETEGEVAEIRKVIDATSLANQNDARKIALNDVAEVVFRLKDTIAYDLFANNHANGRFVIVDGYDVAGGGIILKQEADQEQVSEPEATFYYGDLKARGDLFEEYYYNAQDMKIDKAAAAQETYTVGDKIPVSGESYHYPPSFDIIILRDQAVVKIRDQKVREILTLEQYEYDETVPAVNGRGFAVQGTTREEIAAFLAEYKEQTPETEGVFLNKWVRFETYRQVIFHNNYWVI